MALEEVKPAFGAQEDELSACCRNGIILWGDEIKHLLHNVSVLARQVRDNVNTSVLSVLLHGPSASGKTALAAHIALQEMFPFMKLITPNSFVGHSEASKCHQIANVFNDAYKSQLSIVIIDCIERLLDFTRIGPRFSNVILQAILVLVKKAPPKDRKILIIGTTSEFGFMQESGVASAFHTNFEVPLVSSASHMRAVLSERSDFPVQEVDLVTRSLIDPIGIKHLLLATEMATEFSGGRPITCDTFLNCLRDCGFQS